MCRETFNRQDIEEDIDQLIIVAGFKWHVCP